jgi:aconitase A
MRGPHGVDPSSASRLATARGRICDCRAVDIDLTTEPLGLDRDGRPVMLEDLWPGPDEIRSVISASIDPELFRRTCAGVFEGDDR